MAEMPLSFSDGTLPRPFLLQHRSPVLFRATAVAHPFPCPAVSPADAGFFPPSAFSGPALRADFCGSIPALRHGLLLAPLSLHQVQPPSMAFPCRGPGRPGLRPGLQPHPLFPRLLCDFFFRLGAPPGFRSVTDTPAVLLTLPVPRRAADFHPPAPTAAPLNRLWLRGAFFHNSFIPVLSRHVTVPALMTRRPVYGQPLRPDLRKLLLFLTGPLFHVGPMITSRRSGCLPKPIFQSVRSVKVRV